ncbi:MAG: prepilin-type N-terminal cleavage/methylation domain-containing protein [Parcubacteria group bacterium]|nr:prepilin-type N-terminal cleavage/methylation domain-containing protein [Parcubacteria group bacterium]
MIKKNKGFTLIELLVVIAIIGILAGIVLVSLSTVRSRGRDARRQGDLESVRTALELYLDANNTYPAGSGTTLADTANALPSALSPTYLGKIPGNPTPSGTPISAYQYFAGTATPLSTYLLRVSLENGNSAGINSLPTGFTAGGTVTCGDGSSTDTVLCFIP